MDGNPTKTTVSLKPAKTNPNRPQPLGRRGLEQAFTRLDLYCLIALLATALSLAAWNFTGERGRIMHCAHNLKKLDQAMQAYAAEHDGGLPPARSEEPQSTWDWEIARYIRPDMVVSNSVYARRRLEMIVGPGFVCPSDSLRAHPRSYAMSWHDMQPENWPPGPGNATGVGIAWDKGHVEAVLGEGAWLQAKTNRSLLTPVKRSWLPDPANTLLLTELIRPDNLFGRARYAAVGNAREQVEALKGAQSRFHNGRLNYLMADGHVELLSPFEIGSPGGFDAVRAISIWSIRAGD